MVIDEVFECFYDFVWSVVVDVLDGALCVIVRSDGEYGVAYFSYGDVVCFFVYNFFWNCF